MYDVHMYIYIYNVITEASKSQVCSQQAGDPGGVMIQL